MWGLLLIMSVPLYYKLMETALRQYRPAGAGCRRNAIALAAGEYADAALNKILNSQTDVTKH